jgi:hypothetical protein
MLRLHCVDLRPACYLARLIVDGKPSRPDLLCHTICCVGTHIHVAVAVS